MRGRGWAAAGVVAVVALVVPVSLAALAGVDESAPGTPAPAPADRRTTSPAGDPAAAAALSCSDDAVPAETLPVAASVVAARMCDTTSGVAQWFAPQDGLHAALEPLLELLGELEPMPASTSSERYFCTDDGGYGFDLRLALTSGDVVSILGDTGGCSTVTIGGQDLIGSDEVLATFLALLAEQRDGAVPAAAALLAPFSGRPADPGRPPPMTSWHEVVPTTSSHDVLAP